MSSTVQVALPPGCGGDVIGVSLAWLSGRPGLANRVLGRPPHDGGAKDLCEEDSRYSKKKGERGKQRDLQMLTAGDTAADQAGLLGVSGSDFTIPRKSVGP